MLLIYGLSIYLSTYVSNLSTPLSLFILTIYRWIGSNSRTQHTQHTVCKQQFVALLCWNHIRLMMMIWLIRTNKTIKLSPRRKKSKISRVKREKRVLSSILLIIKISSFEMKPSRGRIFIAVCVVVLCNLSHSHIGLHML